MSVNIEIVLLAMLAAKEIYKETLGFLKARRRANGSGLEKAYRQTGVALDSLYQLYREIAETGGFHSIRMLSVHNSGADLAKTMLWKGTILATYPHDADGKSRWNEHPLDPEYITRVLRPISEEGWKCLRKSELTPDGALGTQYARLGIEQSLLFLIAKSDSEIVFASVSFEAPNITPDQLDAIRSCESQISHKLKG